MLPLLWNVLFAVSVSAQIGHLGHMLGVQEFCEDFWCHSAHIGIVNYTFPPPAEHKGYELVRLTKDYPGDVEMFIARYNTYDNAGGRYIFLSGSQVDESDPMVYDLYTANLTAPDPNSTVTHIVVESLAPKGVDKGVWAIQYDSIDKKLFVLCDDGFWTLDMDTAALTFIGALSDTPGLAPTLCEDYDETSHQWFISVTDSTAIKYLLTYNTRTGKSFMTPNLNPTLKHDYDSWYLYGMKYVPRTDNLIVFADNNNGGPSIKYLDYRTGNHTDMIAEYVWASYQPGMIAWAPQSVEDMNLFAYDKSKNIFWVTVQWNNPEGEIWDTLLYYNLTKGGVEMGSGPMPLDENSVNMTNYVWFGKQ
jgi:hypothetical protein